MTSWFAPELRVLPLAARRCLVRNPLNGASLELSSGEHAVLSGCAGWGTLAEHEARAVARLRAPAEHRPAIRELLERCAGQRLLVPVAELVSRFGTLSAAEPAAFAGVVVRTADRPRLLERLLASAATLEARATEKWRWLVIDDSHDPANERANRAVIANARALDIEHYDRAAAAALQNALLAEFPRAAHEITWLLAPASQGEATYGRPLNHALLRLAGRAFVSVDDDVLLEPRRPALADPGFAVSDTPDELTWYESEESLLQQCPPADLDPIAQHAQWLGLPLAGAWARAEAGSGPLGAIDIAPAQASHFAADARVLFTHGHACGDPGSTTLPLHLLALPARSREWLAANPDAAAYAFARRINWRGRSRLLLTPRPLLTLTTMAGLDNSRLLPPTARRHRSEDLLLGAVAQWMHRSAWCVELPFGVPHRRDPAKRWLAAGDAVAPEPLPFLFAYLERYQPASIAARPEERLAAAGALFADLAAASDARLRELLLEHEMEAASRVLFAIREQLDDATLPAAWKNLLVPWLASPALALDEASLRKRTPVTEAMRPLLDAYGRALLVWPRLWEFCRERDK
jgi:hypothetical protein